VKKGLVTNEKKEKFSVNPMDEKTAYSLKKTRFSVPGFFTGAVQDMKFEKSEVKVYCAI